jgi:hypothetical protein
MIHMMFIRCLLKESFFRMLKEFLFSEWNENTHRFDMIPVAQYSLYFFIIDVRTCMFSCSPNHFVCLK